MKVIYDTSCYDVTSIRNYGGGNMKAIIMDKSDNTKEVDIGDIYFADDIKIGDGVYYFHNNIKTKGYAVDIFYSSPDISQMTITVYNEKINEVEIVNWGHWILEK